MTDEEIKLRKCPTCGKEQLWDILWGFAECGSIDTLMPTCGINKITEQEIKPCPFCNGDSCVFMDDINLYGLKPVYIHYVQCDLCESRSSSYDEQFEAIIAWNTRVGEK